MTLTRTVAPAAMVISLEEARLHLRIDHGSDDKLLEHLILAATDHVEGAAGMLGGRCLLNQTWRETFRSFPLGRPACDAMVLSLRPVSDAVVTYFDSAGDLQTLAPELYRLVDTDGGVVLEAATAVAWPATEQGRRAAVTVEYVAGYGDDPHDVPAAIRQAILMFVGAWYENREETVIGVSVGALPTPASALSLLAPYRVRFLAW